MGGNEGRCVGLPIVLKSQPPGTLKPCTRIALPSHFQSAVCRSTQFATSINNVVSSVATDRPVVLWMLTG